MKVVLVEVAQERSDERHCCACICDRVSGQCSGIISTKPANGEGQSGETEKCNRPI